MGFGFWVKEVEKNEEEEEGRGGEFKDMVAEDSIVARYVFVLMSERDTEKFGVSRGNAPRNESRAVGI